MGIKSVLLFGSRARKDHSEVSDTDILLIVSENENRRVSIGRVTMFFYPWKILLHEAKKGNLFACHITYEAKPLFDPDEYHLRLRRAFRLRKSYGSEISKAIDLGWFLLRFGGHTRGPVVARRVIWCVRTILIARTAENGRPMFSPRELSKSTLSKEGRFLLANRHQVKFNSKMQKAMRLFLSEFPHTALHIRGKRLDFVSHFKETGNQVALDFVNRYKKKEKIEGGYFVISK
jgi:hypothetical protein